MLKHPARDPERTEIAHVDPGGLRVRTAVAAHDVPGVGVPAALVRTRSPVIGDFVASDITASTTCPLGPATNVRVRAFGNLSQQPVCKRYQPLPRGREAQTPAGRALSAHGTNFVFTAGPPSYQFHV